MEEEWRPIPGYEGYYEASTYGRIRAVGRIRKGRWGTQKRREHVLSLIRIPSGYLHVKLHIDNVPETKSVHRLVASTFIPNPNNYPQVNHKDGDKSNNRVENLEWCTGSQNQLHSRRVLKKHCGKPKKPVVCFETGEVYESLCCASHVFGINSGSILMVCQGRNHTAGGLHFAFLKDVEGGELVHGEQDSRNRC